MKQEGSNWRNSRSHPEIGGRGLGSSSGIEPTGISSWQWPWFEQLLGRMSESPWRLGNRGTVRRGGG